MVLSNVSAEVWPKHTSDLVIAHIRTTLPTKLGCANDRHNITTVHHGVFRAFISPCGTSGIIHISLVDVVAGKTRVQRSFPCTGYSQCQPQFVTDSDDRLAHAFILEVVTSGVVVA